MSRKKIEILQQDNYLQEECEQITLESDERLKSENKNLKAELASLKTEFASLKAELLKTKKENEQLNEELSKVNENDSKPNEDVEMYINLAKRVQADFDNYRKRNVEAIKQAKEEGVGNAVKTLLPSIDAIYRAIEYTKDEDTLMGLKMVSDKFESCLSSLGVRKFESVGKPFDASVHSAISSMEKAGVTPNVVIEEIESGYMIGDKVLRYALVVISK